MKKVIGVYQSGADSFTDKAGKEIAYDNIELWYTSDEIPSSMDGKFVGELPHHEKIKRDDVQTFGVPFADWFDLVGAEIEFFYTKDKKEQMKVYGVFVQSIAVADKNSKKES